MHRYLSKPPELKSVLKKTRENIGEARKINATCSNTVVTNRQYGNTTACVLDHTVLQAHLPRAAARRLSVRA